MKRTVAYFNPGDIKEAKKRLAQIKRENPKETYVLEQHSKWRTLDIKKVIKEKKKKKSSSFLGAGLRMPKFRL